MPNHYYDCTVHGSYLCRFVSLLDPSNKYNRRHRYRLKPPTIVPSPPYTKWSCERVSPPLRSTGCWPRSPPSWGCRCLHCWCSVFVNEIMSIRGGTSGLLYEELLCRRKLRPSSVKLQSFSYLPGHDHLGARNEHLALHALVCEGS